MKDFKSSSWTKLFKMKYFNNTIDIFILKAIIFIGIEQLTISSI